MNSSAIAKLAGVSRSTVSRVINGYANVPSATRDKVMAVIDKYGYEPNNAARNLAGKPNRTIGLFMIDMDAGNTDIVQSSPFFSEFLVHLADKLQAREYQLLVAMVRDEKQLKNIAAMFAGQTISGAILMGDAIPVRILRHLSAGNGPCLLLNQRDEIDLPNILLLNTANYRSSFAAVETLIQYGHRRIAYIGGPLDKDSTRNRYRGYRDCLKKHRIPFAKRLVAFNRNVHREDGGFASAMRIFTPAANRPSAVFCVSDAMALGALRALGELGLRIPQDVSLIGHDNSDSSRLATPTLSTLATSFEELAEMAVEGLYAHIERRGEGPRNFTLEKFEIIIRGSIAKYGAGARPKS